MYVQAVFGDDLTLVSPNGGGLIVAGASTTITWTSSQQKITSVKLALTINSGKTWQTIIDSTPNSGSYSWIVPDLSSDSCKVIVSDRKNPNTFDQSDAVFKIVQYRKITITSPKPGDTFKTGTKQSVTWNTYGKIDSVKIAFSSDNGQKWILFTSKTANKGEYTFFVPDLASKSCKIKVTATLNPEVFDTTDSTFSVYNPNISIMNTTGFNKNESFNIIGSFQNNFRINFRLVQKENVSINVYSLQGKTVATLLNEVKSPGGYTISWNAANTSGEKVATGTYLLKTAIGTKIFNTRLTVIK